MQLPRYRLAGFTLPELIIACFFAGGVTLLAFQALRADGSLPGKDFSIDPSQETVRSTLDRLENHIRASRSVPTLLNADGKPAASGPAAGIRYDRILGEPYVLTPVAGAESLRASAASVSVWRSMDERALDPIPAAGDAVIIDTPTGQARATVSGVIAEPPIGDRQRLTFAFAGGLGKPLTWSAQQAPRVRLVRHEAFIVVPVNGKHELRYFPSFETAGDVHNPAHYTVITDQIGTEAGDETPFRLVDVRGDENPQPNVRVQTADYNRWLTGKQSGECNTAFRMDLIVATPLRSTTLN